MCDQLRAEGMRVTMFDGSGRDGPVQMLFIETERRGSAVVLNRAREIDPACFYIVDDIRVVSANAAGPGAIPDQANVVKRK